MDRHKGRNTYRNRPSHTHTHPKAARQLHTVKHTHSQHTPTWTKSNRQGLDSQVHSHSYRATNTHRQADWQRDLTTHTQSHRHIHSQTDTEPSTVQDSKTRSETHTARQTTKTSETQSKTQKQVQRHTHSHRNS